MQKIKIGRLALWRGLTRSFFIDQNLDTQAQHMADMVPRHFVLRLWHDGKNSNVAVRLDKELGSAETAAEIARAFGVNSVQIKSILAFPLHGPTHTPANPAENIPLNLNGYDIGHAYNLRIKNLLFGDRYVLRVEFAPTERSYREHE